MQKQNIFGQLSLMLSTTLSRKKVSNIEKKVLVITNKVELG